MSNWLRDPLVHFAVLGLLVFAAHAMITDARAADAATIHITTADMERMAALYAAEAGTLPSPVDMTAMVADKVRDEALAREARALGLDYGDTIIERRLGQKMTFMVADLSEIPNPGDAELRDWHAKHSDVFSTPHTVTFDHVFISRETASPAHTRAAALMEQLNTAPSPDEADNWRTLGDPFMLQRSYGRVPLREVSRQFGTGFPASLSAMTVSEVWQGPVPSALGLHLIRLTENTPPTLIAFDDARADVERHWRDQAQRAANAKAINDIIAKYDIVIEGVDE